MVNTTSGLSPRYAVTITRAVDGDGTFVVTGQAKDGGGYWGMHTSAYEALQIMLRQAGGISRIGTRKQVYVNPSENGEDPKDKAIRTLYIPHKPEDLTVSIGPIDGGVNWVLSK